MSKRVVELFLFDIYVAIVKIEHTAAKFSNSQDLLHDYLSWDSVVREFEIVGEAVNTLIKNGLLDESNRMIVDFRNLLIHHYFGIDPDEVWNVIEDDLGYFKEMIIKRIHTIDSTLKDSIVRSLLSEFSYLPFVVEKLVQL